MPTYGWPFSPHRPCPKGHPSNLSPRIRIATRSTCPPAARRLRHPHHPRSVGHRDVSTPLSYTHILNRDGPLEYVAPSTAKTQRSRADGILLTKRPQEPRDEPATGNHVKSLGLEAPTRPKSPAPAAALMLLSQANTSSTDRIRV